jgi:hypothetical protein
MRSSKYYRRKINALKQVFEKEGLKFDYDDSFYLSLIQAVIEGDIKDYKVESKTKEVALNHEQKLEIMMTIESMLNVLKGTTKWNRFSFGLDIASLPLQVFLKEASVFSDYNLKKKDVIVFYDDTLIRSGNRGFAITKDLVITNNTGISNAFLFGEMTQRPSYIKGHRFDVIRLYLEDKTIDLKVKKHTKYTEEVMEILSLLFQYHYNSDVK